MRFFNLFLVVILAFGCGSKPPTCELPQQTGLIIDASDRLNPDESGRSLPTIIRIYQMKEVSKLEMATFQDVWQRADATLGEAVVGKDEVTIYPGRRIVRNFERNPEANYIAAVAIVRRPSGVTWRTVFELPQTGPETQCAAQQQNPDEPPPPAPTVRIHLRVEDYRIEGEMNLIESGGCTGDTLECIMRGVEDAQAGVNDASSTVNQAAESARPPQLPQMPQAPQAPTPPVPTSPVP